MTKQTSKPTFTAAIDRENARTWHAEVEVRRGDNVETVRVSTHTTKRAAAAAAGRAEDEMRKAETSPDEPTKVEAPAKVETVDAAPERTAPKTKAGETAVDLTGRAIVDEVVEAALRRAVDSGVDAKALGRLVDGGWLVVSEETATETVRAMTEHMTAIIRENRGANMYRARQLRRIVRPAVLAAFPTSAAGLRQSKTKTSSAEAKLARVEALNAKLKADREAREAAKAARAAKASA